MRAASLNYRDLVLATTQHQPVAAGVVPLSDGAGEIAALGEGVEGWKVGDRVTPILCPDHLAGADELLGAGLPPCLGGTLPGVLAQFHVARASAIVRIADHLSFEEAATLACAGTGTGTAAPAQTARPVQGGRRVGEGRRRGGGR
jgi:NADPH:quinone reductase-like Zn-dependent oxidoreductase